MPQLGAVRATLTEDEWQAKVVAWMREAQLVILMAGAIESRIIELQYLAFMSDSA
jgi:hypothetical protein